MAPIWSSSRFTTRNRGGRNSATFASTATCGLRFRPTPRLTSWVTSSSPRTRKRSKRLTASSRSSARSPGAWPTAAAAFGCAITSMPSCLRSTTRRVPLGQAAPTGPATHLRLADHRTVSGTSVHGRKATPSAVVPEALTPRATSRCARWSSTKSRPTARATRRHSSSCTTIPQPRSIYPGPPSPTRSVRKNTPSPRARS